LNLPKHHTVPVQAVKQFTSTTVAFTLAKNYIPEQRYGVNDRKKDFMINYNESDLYHPEIKPGLPDSQSIALPIELTRQHIV
jgi:hypothetical protein